jgi:hypothetical protein
MAYLYIIKGEKVGFYDGKRNQFQRGHAMGALSYDF